MDQNFDTYGVEYTFADGAKLMLDGRCMPGCHNDHSSCAHGTKGSAVISKSGDCGPPSSTYRTQTFDRADLIWQSETPPAAHTGRIVTFDEALQDDQEFAPGVDKFTVDSPPPVQADADGRYPVPQPGIVTQREY